MTRPRIGSLFSGYGGLDQAIRAALGGEVAWVSDIDKGACKILAHHHPDVPNLGDVTAVDWSSVEPVDIMCGGFPCQPVSGAGKRLGDQDERWLWDDFARGIRVVRPRLVVLESVRGLFSAGGGRLFGRVLGSLADLGYDARWQGLRAADVGAPHPRYRVFVVAQDADRATGDQWGLAAPGQAEGRWARADARRRGGTPTADAGSERHGREQDARVVGCLDGEDPASSQQWERAREVASHRGHATDFGQYAAAVRRWERLTRPAPSPVLPGRGDRSRLSPVFVEWMMGLPEGHVTGVPGLRREDMLKALGNGVVPQQAEAALRSLLGVTASEAVA